LLGSDGDGAGGDHAQKGRKGKESGSNHSS
jgi:hypothetical protein